ncbi:hypothetical protein D6783_01310 [Candidatus Woesearchaeota archaeon]|nr:MAG: hypothetical protein D6783_01310 [Candidatus Woesearchaeota archaeon]
MGETPAPFKKLSLPLLQTTKKEKKYIIATTRTAQTPRAPPQEEDRAAQVRARYPQHAPPQSYAHPPQAQRNGTYLLKTKLFNILFIHGTSPPASYPSQRTRSFNTWRGPDQ